MKIPRRLEDLDKALKIHVNALSAIVYICVWKPDFDINVEHGLINNPSLIKTN